MNREASEIHPGEPPRGALYGDPVLEFDHEERSVYTQRPLPDEDVAMQQEVVHVSRRLYTLNPLRRVLFGERKASEAVLKHDTACRDRSVAVIARALLNAESQASLPKQNHWALLTMHCSSHWCCQFASTMPRARRTRLRPATTLCTSAPNQGSEPFSHCVCGCSVGRTCFGTVTLQKGYRNGARTARRSRH